MSDGFTLSLPVDARYLGLASEIAGKYAELLGGSAADASALSTAVAGAVERAANGAESGDLLIEYQPKSGGVGVTLRWNGQSAEVRHPLPARNP